ncbi:MAG: cation-transporting P-type ATPase [Ruminococcaceae bacterium]|nr:cation-transporting P-type ATPase [Oscillospiraceae bacterium]
MNEKWYHLTTEQIEARLKTDSNVGLSAKSAAKRIRDEGSNTVYDIPRVYTSGLCRDVLRDPCAYMLLCAAVLSFVFKEPIGGAVIIGIVLLNWFIVLAAYIKARMIISDSSLYSLPLATVMRDAKQYIVNQDKLCRGDIIILNKGDVIPADARVIESKGLIMNEFTLTGEKALKKKSVAPVYGNNLPLELQHDMVFATTVVASGRGRAIVCRTGRNNMACVREAVPTVSEHDKLGVLRGLKKYGTVWGTLMLLLLFIITVLELTVGFNAGGLFRIFSVCLATAAAGMCEFYIIFAYIILGRGLYGILRRDKDEKTGATVKRSESIETLSNIDTVIMPKEGAFTSGTIRLEKLYCDSTLLSCSEKRLERLCKDLISCALDSTSYAQNDYEKAFNRFKAKNVSAQERTILACAQRVGIFDIGYVGTHILLDHKEYSGKGTVFKSLITDGKQNKLVIRGGLEDILPLCCDYRSHERARSIKNEKHKIKTAHAQAIKEGYNAVCIASRITDAESIPDTDKDRDFIFEGFLAISEPSLPRADIGVKRMQNAGVRVIMLSDEASIADRNYAKSLGIVRHEDQIMTSAYFRRMSDSNFIAKAENYTLYEGLDNTQKHRLVSLLRSKGECVGFFTNDFDQIQILEEADIGYSSGITLNKGDSVIDLGNETVPIQLRREEDRGKGCEAMKLKCDVIVSPADRRGGGFNAIVESVLQSKTVLANLSRTVRYLVCSHTARIFAVLGALLLSLTVAKGDTAPFFTPVQMLTLGAVADLCAVMVIVFCPAQRRHIPGKPHFFERPVISNLKSVSYGLWWGGLSVLLPYIARIFGARPSVEQASAIMFLGLIASQPVVLCETICEGSVFKEIRYKLSRAFLYQMLLTLALIICPVFIKPMARVLGIVSLLPVHWMCILLLPLIILGVLEFSKIVIVKESFVESEDETYEDEKD